MVRIEVKTKRFIADAQGDELPRVGVMFDGAILTEPDLPVGSTVLYRDTGKIKRWNGHDWAAAETTDNDESLLAAILAEIRELKTMIAMTL